MLCQHRFVGSRSWFLVVVACGLVVVPAVVAQTQGTPDVKTSLESAAIALEEHRPSDAMDVLRSVEHLERDNPWMWFYRGLAQLELGDWYGSMENLDRAQDLLTAHGGSDPQLAAGIAEYRRRARNQVFNVTYQAGLTYDGNVTFLGSGGAGFNISGRGDGKFTSRLELQYAPIADATETVIFGVRASDSWHFRIDEFDEQDYGVTMRYSRVLSERWKAAVQYDYDIYYLGNEPFLSDHAVSPSVEYSWPHSVSRFRPIATTLLYKIESRDFLFDTAPEFDRDGFTNAVAVEQSFKLQPIGDSDWTWDVYGGYLFESVATEGSEFDRLDHVFSLGFAMPLSNPLLPAKSLTLRFDAAWEIADYRRNSVIDFSGDERSDLITALGAVLSQQLFCDPETGDVTLHGIVGWTNADSNVTLRGGPEPFTYDKWVAGIQLEWSW